MPYSTPSSPDRPPTHTMLTHRRTRSSSNFSDERGPGAFVSLGALPRSHKRAVFHINVPDDDNNDDSPHNSPPNTLRLSLNSAHSPINSPGRIQLPPLSTDSVPFPTSSPLSPPPGESPFIPRVASQPTASPLVRTPSTPIILSNGKRLKSSLKSSSSTPNIVDTSPSPPAHHHHRHHPHTKHLRAQSAPSTPNPHKNVHFAEGNLETVRVFSRSGKPASLSKPPGEETETETEAESSSYPFPLLPVPTTLLHEIDPDPHRTSPIPNPTPSQYANIHIESLALPRTRPPTLRGTVLVRNMSFGKGVAVRFTLDEWQTTSEVTCRHVVSLPSLPPPFARPRTVGDLVGAIANGEKEGSGSPTWDRFSFTIRLEDYELKLAERTLYLVARYNPDCGGEYWDNNESRNYRVAFRRASPSPMGSPKGSAVSLGLAGLVGAHEGMESPAVRSQQRTFSAPSTLKTTPTTGALAQAAHGSPPSITMTPATPPTPPEAELATPTPTTPTPRAQAPPLVRSISSPFPTSPPPPPRTEPPSAATSPGAGATLPGHQAEWRAGTNTAFERLARRLSLVNYAAPTATLPAKKDEDKGMFTPPTTPPKTGGVTLPAGDKQENDDKDDESDDEGDGEDEAHAPRARKVALSKPTAPSSTIIGGMPATIVRTSPPPRGGSPNAGSPPLPTASSASASPPSTSRFGLDFAFPSAPAYGAPVPRVRTQLLSPPRSLEGSPTGTPRPRSPNRPWQEGSVLSASPTSLSDTSTSSASATEPATPLSAVVEQERASTPTPLTLGLAHLTGATSAPGGPGSPRVDPSDSSYAAFVRQWCFAQSTPPAPAPSKVERMNTGPAQVRGYGFPGFNFGMPDAGMVGAHMR